MTHWVNRHRWRELRLLLEIVADTADKFIEAFLAFQIFLFPAIGDRTEIDQGTDEITRHSIGQGGIDRREIVFICSESSNQQIVASATLQLVLANAAD